MRKLLIASLVALSFNVFADDITVAWDSVTATVGGKSINPGYRVYRGLSAELMLVACETTLTECVINVDKNELAFYAVTAYTIEDGESDNSSIVGPLSPAQLRPGSPSGVRIELKIVIGN